MGWIRDLFRGEDRAGTVGFDAEQRSLTAAPWIEPYSAVVTQDRALSLAPVFAANNLIAGTLSTLPLKAYRRVGEDRTPRTSLPVLFANLEADHELVPWLHRCLTSLGLRGNAFGLVTSRDGYGYPTGLEWLNPAEVDEADPATTAGAAAVFGGPPRARWLYKGRPVPDEDIVHIPWFTVPGQRKGLSPVGAFAKTMDLGLEAQDYGWTWFKNGGFPPGTFQNTEMPVVDQGQADAIKARVANAIRTRQPLVFGRDWKYEAITVPPNEAQFLETLKLNKADIATIYGLDPEHIGGETAGGSMNYANVEQRQIRLAHRLHPWAVRLEHVFSALLPERQYVRFNFDALIRPETKTRYETYEIAHRVGLLTRNEMRALEDRPPLPGGDELAAQVIPAAEDSPDNVTPLTRGWVNPR